MKAHLILENIEVDPESGCWLYQGRTNRDGYGVAYIDGKSRLVHRVIWELTNGPIPPKHVLDHLKDDRGSCKHRHCCNPAHLEPVTVTVNSQRVVPWNRLKDACPKGHNYDRTYDGKDGYTRRYCSTCERENREVKKGGERVAA